MSQNLLPLVLGSFGSTVEDFSFLDLLGYIVATTSSTNILPTLWHVQSFFIVLLPVSTAFVPCSPPVQNFVTFGQVVRQWAVGMAPTFVYEAPCSCSQLEGVHVTDKKMR